MAIVKLIFAVITFKILSADVLSNMQAAFFDY